MSAFLLVVIATTPFLDLAARVKTNLQSPEDDVCPDGFICEPAPCDIPHSNGKPGKACMCADGFVGDISWKAGVAEGSCSPAPCNTPGTVGDGLDCKCMPGLTGDIIWTGPYVVKGDCIAEAKDLFTHGADHYWKHKEKMIKCCASSLGKPTMLQDMNEGTLPSFGSLGRSSRDGCGYMFGDTYHNGLGSKMRSPTCPASVETLMAVSGSTFDEIASLLGLEAGEEVSLMETNFSSGEETIAKESATDAAQQQIERGLNGGSSISSSVAQAPVAQVTREARAGGVELHVVLKHAAQTKNVVLTRPWAKNIAQFRASVIAIAIPIVGAIDSTLARYESTIT
eukprot:CAMPEP_0169359182 /NCGR_PEP_ID=MMETSP1017-20121227/29079_1 /TAXON_ID=342587 /ORGANISM="Karlodinium micrum, Strain CCMP2283" /LENGTH=339 /DNA_ID=CAMNT_0009456299 /DNA_START=52 /DNA_END=1072 /DNA_ORIENTATION=+